MILETKNMRAIPLLLVGLLAFVPAAEAAEVRADWSKVRETQPGRQTWVRRLQERSPQGAAPGGVRGRFASAGADNITLILSDGQSVTFEKHTVGRVSVRRSVRQRWPAYVAAAAMMALNHAVIVPHVGGTEQEPIVFGLLNLLTTAPVLLVGHFGLGRKIIYEAPAQHRND